MNAGTAYGLGVFTPFVVLMVWAGWTWCTEEAGRWWQDKQPSLGRLRCTLTGHAYIVDNTWVICSRCTHVKRNPEDRHERLKAGE